MKTAPQVATALRTKHNVTAVPKATIEWNLNRYFDVNVYNAVPDAVEENDEDNFPIDSIIQPWRPTKGINKARIGYGYTASSYNDWPTARFYVASEKDKYKYWISPTASDANGVLPNCAPTVLYTNPGSMANKIKIVVENTWASPQDYIIQYTQDGGSSWNNTVAAAIQPDGTIEVFWTGNGWTATRPATLTSSLAINGIRFVCTRLTSGKLVDGSITRTRVSGNLVSTNGSGSYLSVIEMAACLVRDVSDRIISADDNFDAGETSVVSPVGTITTNTGSLTLWNKDDNGRNLFSRDNPNSPYQKLIEQNAEVTYSLVYKIDGTDREVRQFKLYADSWSEGEDGTVTIEMSDASKHLGEVKPNATKYEGMKFTEIMYRLCDSVGWNAYNVNKNPLATDLEVPIFWTDGEQTLWEILNDLAQVSQSVIFFDENGMMNVRSRDDAFNPNAASVWTLRGETAGTELADIVTLDRNGEFGSNSVKIVYKNTRWADINNGFAENSPVWEAEDPTVLRSSPLLYTMEESANVFYMPGNEAAVWPHTGQVLIEGEVVEYEAKQFQYQDNGWKWAWVKSQAEQDELNERVNSTMRHWNFCTGAFLVKERGQWNTPVKRHAVDAEGYTVVRWRPNGAHSGGGFTHDRTNSLVNIRTPGYLDGPEESITVTRGVPGDSPWRYIGTKLAFPSGNAWHQTGGLVFNMGSGRDGYYVEIQPTGQISDKVREVRNEIVLYVIKNGVRSDGLNGKGAAAPIALDSWGELDIWYSIWDQRVKVFYRGKEYINMHVPGEWQLSPSGKFGMFARGMTDVSFSYLYASSRHADPEPDAEYSSLHRISGIYEGRDYSEEWKHRNTRRERNKRKKTKKSIFDKRQRFMDEFGPYVHEFKEFEVKFDPAPVAHSFLYYTNTWASYLIDYSGDAWGARFTMVNTERFHATLAGADSMLNPGAEPVTMYTTIFGRALVIDEGEEVTAKNEQQIRARGEITTEIDSDWIQSKEAAKEISDWIIKHWSDGVDEITVTVFGNPLFHIGDVVSVNYPKMDMLSATHQYFVVGTSNSFDQGLSTTLRLRRRN